MKYSFLFLVGAALFSCKQPAKKVAAERKIDPKVLISCEGIGEVKLSDTHENLEKKFGAKSLSEHENTITGNYTSVWENDPKQVNVFWKEKKSPFKTVKYIEAVAIGGPYLTKDSIRTGITLRDLVKINGSMPVTYKNISQSTDPGLIKSFNGGNIEKSNPCLSGALEQARINTVHKDEWKAFHLKEYVESFDPILNRIDMELSSIRVSAKQ